jgi:Rod binding domain-containing protein
MSHGSSSSAGSAITSGAMPLSLLAGKGPPDSGQHGQLVAQTQKWVAQTFFGQLLKQVRSSPFRSELLDGGRGGQVFGSMYDQRLAEHMARGAGSKLVNSIVKRIEAKQAYQKSTHRKGDDTASHGEGKGPAGGKKGSRPLPSAPVRSGHVPANLRA